MMKRVLFVEDDGLIYETIKNKLVGNIDTERVNSFAAAKGRWKRENGNYDCIVLDLQINPLGLSLKEDDTYAPLYGIAVLDAFSEGLSNEEKTQIRKKTIIYSGYTGILHSRGYDLRNLFVISKSAESINEVVERIKSVCSKS